MGKHKGTGVYANGVTRDLNREAYKKTKKTIEMNERWRLACVANPLLPYKMTFLEFKRRGGKVADVSAENDVGNVRRDQKGQKCQEFIS
jgi:hypothetical protein